MIRDPEQGNDAHEDGADWREASSLAAIAYATWRGPDFDLPTLIAADDTTPLIDF